MHHLNQIFNAQMKPTKGIDKRIEVLKFDKKKFFIIYALQLMELVQSTLRKPVHGISVKDPVSWTTPI